MKKEIDSIIKKSISSLKEANNALGLNNIKTILTNK